jgi:hypothetical protein
MSIQQQHWSQHPDGALLARAVAFVFRKIISPEEEGGCKEFLEKNCSIFDSWTEESEQKIEFTQLFFEFEQKMERVLEDLAEIENLEPSEIVRRIGNVQEGGINAAASKQVKRLLSGVDYKKFCCIMRNKARDLLAALEDDAADSKGDVRVSDTNKASAGADESSAKMVGVNRTPWPPEPPEAFMEHGRSASKK